MIDIVYISNGEELAEATFSSLESLLPEKFSGSFQRYRRWQDRQASLFGKLLLRSLLLRNGLDPELLSSYQIDSFGRPSINWRGDFNISHTDGKVVCALTDAHQIGIDIEKIITIDPLEFTRVFTPQEANYIGTGKERNIRFFDVWTKKEAAMKADGRGFHINPQEIDTLSTSFFIHGKEWHSTPLRISEDYRCHCCTHHPGKQIILKQITKDYFFDFSPK